MDHFKAAAEGGARVSVESDAFSDFQQFTSRRVVVNKPSLEHIGFVIDPSLKISEPIVAVVSDNAFYLRIDTDLKLLDRRNRSLIFISKRQMKDKIPIADQT